MKRLLAPGLVALTVVTILATASARAEVVDEVVAKVNDDIVTKSELDSEEQAVLQQLYHDFSGTDLDNRVAKAKQYLLRQLIDQKVLIQRASHLFDVNKMQDFFLQQFMDQQNIKSEKDLEKLLAQEGMTLTDWKKRLIEVFAPKQVMRAEVSDRIAISEKEARAYYDAHPDEFNVPAEATVREIVLTVAAANRDEVRARAEAIQTRAAAPGADFGAIAAEVSEAGTKTTGGLLGPVKKGDLAAPIEAAAFSVPVDDVSPVIEVDHGFHILKIDARTDAGLKPFDDAKPEIEAKLLNERFEIDSKVYLKKLWAEATIWVSPKYEARLSPAE